MPNSPARTHPAHGERRGIRIRWRAVSLFIVLTMAGLLALFFVPGTFYVHSVGVGGLETLTKEEVFAIADIANVHLFWIDPDQVEANLLASPSVASAKVTLGWPPRMVQVVIQERMPALIWEQGGIATWLDVQGQVMQLREDRSDLPRITYEGLDAFVLGPNDRVSAEIVTGAIQLNRLLPGVTALRYSAGYGLGYRDPRGWDAWFGVGADMPQRVLIYNALVNDLSARGIAPTVISVADPAGAFYSVLGGLQVSYNE